MQTWHAVWDVRGQLSLWVESDEVSSAEPRAAIPAGRLPGVLEGDALRRTGSEVFDFDDLNLSELTLLLPTHGGRPVTEGEIAQGAFSGADVTLESWQVPCMSLDALDTFAFLSSVPNVPPAGVEFGATLLYFRELTKFLLDMLMRGRFLPELARSGEGSFARWQPLITSEGDVLRFQTFLDGFPRVAAMAINHGEVELSSPEQILTSFLAQGVDALVRIFVRRLRPFAQEAVGDVLGRVTVGERWLLALASERAEVTGEAGELARLEGRLRFWAAAAQRTRHLHEVRLVMRVFPPLVENDESAPPEERDWNLDFQLESAADPTLRLRTADLWSGTRGFLERSAHSDEELEAIVLKNLGTAATLFPPLGRALDTLTPVSASLSTKEVHEFLREAAPRLLERGIGIIAPNWWEQPNERLGLSLTVRAAEAPAAGQRRSLLASDQLLDFSWKLSLGETELSEAEFQSLVARDSPLVYIRGAWIELDSAKIQATIRFLEEQESRKKLSLFEALHLGLGLDDRSQILPVTRFQAEGWVQKLLEGSPRVVDLLEEPPGFRGELRPYQREGLTWLMFHADLGLGVCLADDMGLGKTIQFLAWLQQAKLREHEQSGGTVRRPVLLVVPMSILANWENEARRFTPELTVYVHHGTQRLANQAFLDRARSADLVITTYSIVFRDEELISQIEWTGITLDEAQNIKNIETKQSRAVRRLCYEQLNQSRGIRTFSRMALTGTPLENRLEELWSIFDFLNPGFFGTLNDFRTQYAAPIERQRDAGAAAALSRLLRPFVLRRLKSDPQVVSDLPEKIEMNVVVPLTQEQASLYQSALDDMLPQLETASGIHRKGLVLATITKLKQICDHPALALKDGSSLDGRSHKLACVVQLIETMIAEGDKVLIFTQFAQLGHLLQPYLTERLGTEVLFLHGGLSRKDRDQVVTRFQDSAGPPVFVLSLKAGGFGLNLTEANQVIHFDQWWNPAVENQATDRVYRIGQKRNVQVRKILCQGTLEERIAEMLQMKRELAEQVVGSTKDSITKMSTEDLRRLLELGMTSQPFESEEEASRR